jgi:hypothetical protein
LTPEEQKDDKYWARRKKNNMAAKRSRDIRRIKENQIAVRAAFLESEVGSGRPNNSSKLLIINSFPFLVMQPNSIRFFRYAT